MPRTRVPSSALKGTVFAASTLLLLGVLGTLIGNISFRDTRTYSADFSDATGVNPGDRVRISGVEVGRVTAIDLVERAGRHFARVKFDVDSSAPVMANARLKLRYENLVGQRYLTIDERDGDGPQMAETRTFPAGQTTPALNLTELFNGFQPLFQALNPAQVNAFSYQLVRTLQGEGGSLASLMRHTASLTNHLADRDSVIGSVVTNLNTVLRTVDTRDEELTALIVEFRDLMHGLAKDRDVVAETLPDLAELLDGTAGLVADVRGPLKADVSELRSVATKVNADRARLDASLKHLPKQLRTQARSGSHGSWFNFYACGLGVRVGLLNGVVNLDGAQLAANERDTVCGGAP